MQQLDEVSEDLCIWMKKELSLFPYFKEEDLADLPCFFDLVKVRAGETVCGEGDFCDYLAFIVSGRLEISKQTEFPGKNVVIGVYSRGTVMGELCLLDNHPRAVTAVALEDSTLVTLSRDNFNLMLEAFPESGVKFLKGLLLAVSIRLRKSYDRLASIF
ncbi:MAG: cyclic nucleotide-binding domain-containing protein [Deltaproteobacteria bacterium]|nr:cyclic nucleotide-binding domain-containing protein [Deltaproteobacteria bacterium]NIS78042.1 cyclic nucleotide-binding domain-containing protein [Deltaproteobacteria bacterium]